MNPSLAPALMALSDAFSIADLRRLLGKDHRSALTLLSSWEAKGCVRALGGGTGVYLNLLRSVDPDWEMALRLAEPSAMLIGVEPLRRAGWITQITWAPAVAVSENHQTLQVPHFNLVYRSAAWFEAVSAGRRGGECGSLPYLAPAWALADMISEGGWRQCCLDPDDIYWDDVAEADQVEWDAACRALGLGHLPMNPDGSSD